MIHDQMHLTHYRRGRVLVGGVNSPEAGPELRRKGVHFLNSLRVEQKREGICYVGFCLCILHDLEVGTYLSPSLVIHVVSPAVLLKREENELNPGAREPWDVAVCLAWAKAACLERGIAKTEVFVHVFHFFATCKVGRKKTYELKGVHVFGEQISFIFWKQYERVLEFSHVISVSLHEYFLHALCT